MTFASQIIMVEALGEMINELVNLLAVVKALDAPEHKVLAVVKERAVVRLSKAGVSTVDTLLPVERSCAMVLDAIAPPLAKLG